MFEKKKVNQHVCQNGLKPVPGIKNILVVASGKGGVGKSTTAINVALALVAKGYKIGLLDADIHGPSQPLFLNTQTQKPTILNNQFEPILQYGLKTMSIGYLLESDGPMVWRGPMVSRALEQLLYDTNWHDLDYLIVDLPPGTGDIALTLAQKIPVAGALIVTTPQNASVIDAKKALLMFKKLGIAVLGVVENMSVHHCSACGHQESIFGEKGGETLAKTEAVPFLGKLPLASSIQVQTDSGCPSVAFEPTGAIATVYHDVADKLLASLSLQPRDYHLTTSIQIETKEVTKNGN